MKTHWTREAITRALATLPRAASGKGGHGASVAVRLGFTLKEPTEKAKSEARPARLAGFDPTLYTGTLDRVFMAMNGELCFTILCKERIDAKRNYCYRTFNLDSGQVTSLTA